MTAYGTTHTYVMQLVQKKEEEGDINVATVKSHKVDETARYLDNEEFFTHKKCLAGRDSNVHRDYFCRFTFFVRTHTFHAIKYRGRASLSRRKIYPNSTFIFPRCIKVVILMRIIMYRYR